MTTLTQRALNRALLARQMLLSREAIPALRAIERLAGMQAQLARPPFVGLWTRLLDFERDALRALYQNRKVVRATLMRGTIHLMSAKDYLAFRASIQPALTAAMRSIVKGRGAALQEDAVGAAAERCFREKPRTFAQLRDALQAQFPDVDERAMGYVARTCLPLVMVPDRSEYGFASATFALAESWLRQPVPRDERLEDLVMRYLAAFGPATARDAQAWSGIAKLQPVFERLRPRLETFRDESGKELFDVPKAPRPADDTPAPARFIAAFDNLILAHADRTRIIADEYRPRVSTKNLQILPTFLIDGFVAGTWEVFLRKGSATLMVSPFKPLPWTDRAELTAEGEKLVRFVGHDASHFEVLFREE